MKLYSKILLACLAYVLFSPTFAIGQKIDKKVGKEIQKIFSINNFDVKKTINQDFEDYLSNRLMSIYSNNDVIGYAYIDTAPSQTKYFDYLVLFDKEIVIKSIKIYSLLPHRLGHMCRLHGARLIQISSDGVFSGSRGGYTEDDFPDANDV